MTVFRLRFQQQVRGAGSTPPPVNEYATDILAPDDLGIPNDIGDTPASSAPDLPGAAGTLRQMGATPQAPEVVAGTANTVSATDASLERAVHHLNNATDAFRALEGQSGIDPYNATTAIRQDLEIARSALREATHPDGQQGVRPNHSIRTALHPNGVTVAQIQQQLIRLEGRLQAFSSQASMATAAGAAPSANTAQSGIPQHLTPGVPFTVTGNHRPTTVVLEHATYNPVRPQTGSNVLNHLMDAAIQNDPARDLARQSTAAAQATPTPARTEAPASQVRTDPTLSGVRADLAMVGDNLRLARQTSTQTGITPEQRRSQIGFYQEQAGTYLNRLEASANRYLEAHPEHNETDPVPVGDGTLSMSEIRSAVTNARQEFRNLLSD